MEDRLDFRIVNNMIVCEIPPEDCLDREEIIQISEHTVNTWQQDRNDTETMKNTVQGKLAEYVLEKYLETMTDVRYISYDEFREDGFEKHAPFDGLIYSRYIEDDNLNKMTDEINHEVAQSENGQITEKLRRRLERYRIFSLEIKSSQLRLRSGDYRGVQHINLPREKEDYIKITENLKKWDFFVYPYFTRRSSTISSFYDYAEEVRESDEFSDQSNQVYLRNLMLTEFRNASDIYTRLYFDYESNEVFIPGYVLKEDFFRNPRIHKMPGKKSGMALYYMKSIAAGTPFLEINSDDRIWEADITASEKRIFGVQKRCPECGGSLRICNVKKRRTYSYKCFDCEKWFTVDEINEN